MTIDLSLSSAPVKPHKPTPEVDKLQITPPRFPALSTKFPTLDCENARVYNSRQGGPTMWPLSIFLFVATAAPQQQQLNVFQDSHHLQLPVMQRSQVEEPLARELAQENRNTCFTMRSYFFRRQDGQAPVPAGMTTCTPASVLQQRQVSPRPKFLLVPLGATRTDQ